MPEIKHGFTQGKMNKDLDERLVPNGQYRDAMNIQVTTSDGSDIGTVQNILGNKRIDIGGVPNDCKCIGSITDEKNNTIYWFIKSYRYNAILEYKKDVGAVPVFIDINNVLKFPNRTITGINIIDDFLFWTDGYNEPRKINISRCKQGTTSTLADLNSTPNHTKLIVNNALVKDENDEDIDVTEDHITVIRKKPTTALNIKINAGPTTQVVNPGLFEKELCRLSYRYKYEDGEYSAFGPFTDVIFNPLYPDNVDQDSIISVKEPYNKAMLNNIESIDVYDFISPSMPKDVVQIDILYKKEDSPVVYSIASIKPDDPVPTGYGYNYWNESGFNQGKTGYIGSKFKGKYPIISENIYAAVPSNQILRPWDNVPKKTLAQEVTGSRIVYGNYTQNYNVPFTPSLIVDYKQRNNISDFTLSGLPSIKSQRNYQLGVVFGDKYGRETPVYTSTEGAIKIPWENGGVLSASQSYQLTTYLDSGFPSWADYYRFYIKETSTEYYNLIMNRAYTPTSNIANIDSSSEDNNHIWVSFPSSDRNKLKEDDYIILKKIVGANETQFPIQNRFKILDIKNETPDAIKYTFVVLGAHANSTAGTYNGLLDNGGGVATTVGFGAGIYDSPNQRMDVEGNDVIKINKTNFLATGTGDGASLLASYGEAGYDSNVYISWKDTGSGAVTSGQASQRYQVSDVREEGDYYVSKLTESITAEDATIANGTANQLNSNLVVKIERKDEKDPDEFSGRFFIKIVADELTSTVQNSISGTLVDGYTIASEQDSYWWADPENASNDDPTAGIINSSAYNSQLPNDTQSTTGQNVNEVDTLTGTSTLMTTTTTSATNNSPVYDINVSNWKVLKNFHNSKVNGGGFFIDNLTFVAGQCSTDYYAKNAGDPFRGNTTTYGQMTWTNALDTPVDVLYTKWYSSLTYGTGVDANGQTQKNYYPRILSGQDCNADHEVRIWSTAPDCIQHNDSLGNADVMEEEISNNYQSVNDGTYRWKPFSRDSRSGWEHNTLQPQGWLINGPNSSIPTNQPRMSQATTVANAFGTSTGGGFIHALDGIIQTSTMHTHTNGIKRWRANGSLNTGTWIQDNTYGDGVSDDGKFYLHLSFLAPGADLVPDTLAASNLSDIKAKGKDNLGTKLQGIWGGGVFTRKSGETIYSGHAHDARIIECEGNYTGTNDLTNSTVPGPGVGQGYDIGTSAVAGVTYQELHNNQWNPAYPASADIDSKIQEFVSNIHQGAKFKFGADTNNEIYTINSVSVKRLYNHTAWRRRNIPSLGVMINAGDSVEEAAIDWGLNGFGNTAYTEELVDKIKNFGGAHNRRVVYILELDKDPTMSSGAFNPVGGTALLDANVSTDIQFLQSDPRILSGRVSTTPAIWETEPKKSTDLDIYYEAGGIIPVKLNKTNREIFAPVGCKLEFINLSEAANGNIVIVEDVCLKSWGYNGNDLVFKADPGFNDLGTNLIQIDYTGAKIKFIRQDGGYTTGTIKSTESGDGTYRTLFELDADVDPSNDVGLSWYNCFSFGNGIESNRVRDDFNQIQIYNGARASTTTEEPYQEENRKYGLIFSGLYNSNSGLNDLNQFIMAEKITKDLNPTYGSIQKLFSRNTDLVTFCEDRVIKVLANKDAVFNADGNPQLTANANVLGQTIPFVGDFGISQNPESFAKESYRTYFTDKNRGAVLRLSQDGLTPISEAGMHDWFRDNLSDIGALLGTYDDYKKTYNLTLKEAVGENIITNADIAEGTTVVSTTVMGSEILTNISPTGSDLNYYNPISPLSPTLYSVLPLTPTDNTRSSYAGIVNPILNIQPIVNEYPTIAIGDFQDALTTGTIVSVNVAENGDFENGTTNWSIPPNTSFTSGGNAYTSTWALTSDASNPSYGNFIRATTAIEWSSIRWNNIPVVMNETYYLTYTIRNFSQVADGAGPGQIAVLLVIYDPTTDTEWYDKTGDVDADGTYTYTFNITTNSSASAAGGGPGADNIPNWMGAGVNSTLAFEVQNKSINFDIDDISLVKELTVPTPGIPAIPSAQVDAWTEVAASISDWTFDQTEHVTFSTFEATYGTPNPATTETEDGQYFDNSTASILNDGNTYTWYTGTSNNTTTPGTVTPPTNTYNYITNQFDTGSPQPLLLDDTVYINCSTDTNDAHNEINMSQTLATSLVADSWYMLDVAYGTVDTAGIISIDDVEVAFPSGLQGTAYDYAGTGGYGRLGITTGYSEVQLVNTYPDGTAITKQYYNNPNESDLVYRTIFKLHSGSSLTNVLKIKFTGFQGQVKGVWLNKLDALPTGGTIDADWNNGSANTPEINWATHYSGQDFLQGAALYSSGTPIQGALHSLAVPDKYFKDNKYNFNNSKGGRLQQLLATHPLPTNSGYELLFTLEDAISPIDSTIIPIGGKIYGYVTGQDGSSGKTGIRFDSLVNPPVGQYRIRGNFDRQGPYSAEILDNNVWVATTNFVVKDYEDAAGSAPTAATSRIYFRRKSPQFTGAIKNISLKDRTTTFSGTTADAWSFTGNDPSVSPYVSFINETIVFDNAPIGTKTEQLITQNINISEVYNITFDYTLTTGNLDIYYFNTNGDGFRISTDSWAQGSDNYNTNHTIGDDTIISGELNNTFVIVATTADTNAVIDNISMQRVYIPDEETTLSYSEDVKGWVSFKSFIPESGVSMSKKYYTIYKGGLYEHHSENENRNTFYGVYAPSTLTAVLNDSPSTVKIYNTLNYEGSQSKIQQYSSGTNNNGVTIYDAKPYNISSKDGWYVDYFKTDKQKGTINEFIEKEGKWFNYIRGNTSDINTADFSFQGIGIAETITQ